MSALFSLIHVDSVYTFPTSQILTLTVHNCRPFVHDANFDPAPKVSVYSVMAQMQVGCVEITLGCEQAYLKRVALQFGSDPFERFDEKVKEGGWLQAWTFFTVGITEPVKLSMMDFAWYACRIPHYSVTCFALGGAGSIYIGVPNSVHR